jgi:hypothetical protein
MSWKTQIFRHVTILQALEATIFQNDGLQKHRDALAQKLDQTQRAGATVSGD